MLKEILFYFFKGLLFDDLSKPPLLATSICVINLYSDDMMN